MESRCFSWLTKSNTTFLASSCKQALETNDHLLDHLFLPQCTNWTLPFSNYLFFHSSRWTASVKISKVCLLVISPTWTNKSHGCFGGIARQLLEFLACVRQAAAASTDATNEGFIEELSTKNMDVNPGAFPLIQGGKSWFNLCFYIQPIWISFSLFLQSHYQKKRSGPKLAIRASNTELPPYWRNLFYL